MALVASPFSRNPLPRVIRWVKPDSLRVDRNEQDGQHRQGESEDNPNQTF